MVEKALGSIAKSGKSAISEVLSRPAPDQTRSDLRGNSGKRLRLRDATGCIRHHRSGVHHRSWYPLRPPVAVPVIKMATRTELANRWFDLMDINAGTIATGEETIEDVGWKLFHFILDVASGRKKTFSDQWGLHNQLAVFNPAPVT